MSIRQRRYGTHISRGLLLAGYLFLFAGQFNCQYFIIANFFVYGKTNSASVKPSRHATPDRLSVNARNVMEQHSAVLPANTEQPAHLAIDKRFQFKQAIRVPQIRAPGLTACIILHSRVPRTLSNYVSSRLSTNTLRGPPCA